MPGKNATRRVNISNMSNVVPFIYSDNAVLCYSWYFIRYLQLQKPNQHGVPIQQEAPNQQEGI